MERPSFDSLSEERFRQQLRPAALRIYQQLFPTCRLEDLREQGVRVHILDKEFAIDSLLVMPDGHYFTIQEKYRSNKYLINPKLRLLPNWPDFTQEYKNAVGTRFEGPGEWFKLAAQLYFYGWANADGSDFEKWLLMDVAKYKMIVSAAGGLEAIGKLKINSGRNCANFYAIPIVRIASACLAHHNSPYLGRHLHA